jgi:hypothetical protein
MSQERISGGEVLRAVRAGVGGRGGKGRLELHEILGIFHWDRFDAIDRRRRDSLLCRIDTYFSGTIAGG